MPYRMKHFFVVLVCLDCCFALTCSRGSYWTGHACALCDVGTYTDNEGSTACQVCPLNTEAPVKGSVLCTLCRMGTHKPAGNSTGNCQICAFGHYMQSGTCNKCQSLHAGYCDALEQSLLEENFNVDFDINACHQFIATQNTVALCDTCNCSISRNSIPFVPIHECKETNYYVSSLTNSCEYCPSSYYIVKNHCVPFSAPAVGTDMYGKCVAGYFKVQGICTACPKGTFSTSSRDRTCTTCPRNLTTKYEASIHEDDCAFCSNNQFQVFVSTTGYRCKPCDVCTTRREATHMFPTCHKCQIQDIQLQTQNCVLSQMGNCETYFETDDAVKSCAKTPLPPNLECTAINLPRVYTTVYKNPLDFQLNAMGVEKLKVTSHKLNWGFTFELMDVQPYLSWIQFSNIVNQNYMLERNAKFKNCLKAGGDDILELCGIADDEFTIEDPGLRVSTRYLSIANAQINYYKNLLARLTVIPGTGQSLQNGCILPSTHRFNQVTVEMTPVNIDLRNVKRIIIQSSDLLNTTCNGICMNGASVRMNLPARDICNIYFDVDKDEKTNNTFSVRFSVLTNERTLFSGLLVSKRIHLATNFYFCSGSQFIKNPAYIKDNIEYDNLQKFVSPGMCTGKDYSHE